MRSTNLLNKCRVGGIEREYGENQARRDIKSRSGFASRQMSRGKQLGSWAVGQ